MRDSKVREVQSDGNFSLELQQTQDTVTSSHAKEPGKLARLWKMDEISMLKESARIQNRFGLTREQHDTYMGYLDGIRNTRVDRNVQRRHKKSMNRVKKKLTQLKEHYGNKKLPYGRQVSHETKSE